MSFCVGLKAPFTNNNTSKEEKMLERPHNRWSYREMSKGTSPRGSSSSDLTNVSQVNFTLTYVTFQEVPATKIDFR